MKLRDRIRLARKNARITQAELATRLGVVPSAIAQWERPRGTAPTATNLARVAECLHVPFEWLATGRGSSSMDGIELPAVESRDFAMDGVEERLLVQFRQLAPAHRTAIARLVETMAAS